MFRIPYFAPGWDAGIQIVNLGQGGPSSHMGLQPLYERSYPTFYAVTAYGLGGMPRQVMGPTKPIQVNAYSQPPTTNNLQINGLMKAPRGG